MARTREYTVRVAFFADGDEYGNETYAVTAANAFEAKKLALQRSEDSMYADDRIDYHRTVKIITDES